MLKAPRYIQAALDRFFPGTRLEWHPRLQWWVLTDYAHWPDGMPARDIAVGVTNLMRGISRWPRFTNRMAILFLGTIEEGVKAPLSLFQILETLRKHRRAPTPKAVAKTMDELEAREAGRAERQKAAEHAASRDRASDIWNSLKKSMFGAGVRRTPWSHARAADEEFKRQTLEQSGDMAAEADREVERRIQEGAGIAAVRRSPQPMVT